VFRFNFLEPGYRSLHSEPLRVFESRCGQEIFSLPYSSRRLCVLLVFLFSGYRVFPGNTVAGAWRSHPPLSSAEVENKWSHTFMPPLCLLWHVNVTKVMFIQRLLKHAPSDTARRLTMSQCCIVLHGGCLAGRVDTVPYAASLVPFSCN